MTTIPDILRRVIDVAGLTVVAAPEESPPFPVEAVAVEEDTYLVLSSDHRLRVPEEHPLRIVDSAFNVKPEEPGRVLVRRGSPLRLLAVVHDLKRQPSCREEWVKSAFLEILQLARRRQIHSLGLPLLGTVHGRLKAEHILLLLEQALADGLPRSLRRLWIVVPAEI